MATCGVSPSPVTLGGNPGNSTLTMTAPTTLAAVALPLNEGSRNAAYAVVLPIPALLLAGIGLALLNFKKCRHSVGLLSGSVIVLFAVLVGCGGGSIRHTPQSHAVTVTAANASGSLHHSTIVTLTVR